MFRKILLTIAAAAVLATSSFASASYASDQGFEVRPVHNNRGQGLSNKQIAAGLALGVVAGLLGAKFNSDHGQQRDKGFNNRNAGFKSCKDVPIFGGKRGDRVVAFRQVCR